MSDDFSPYGLNHVAQARRKLERGEPCSHPGCLSHVSHPCEGCGRVGGTITLEEALAIEAENKRLADEFSRLKAEIDAGNRAYQQLWASYEEATRIAAVHATELAALKARRCETCRHWNRVADSDFGVCGFWTDDRSTWHAYDDERCRNWRDKEAADAD